MAKIFLEGFDLWTNTPVPGPTFNEFSRTGDFVVNSSQVPFADTPSQSLNLFSGSSSQAPTYYFIAPLSESLSEYVAGFYFKYVGPLPVGPRGSGSSGLISFQDASGSSYSWALEVGIDSSGVLHITNGISGSGPTGSAATFASGTTQLLENNWYFIEFQVNSNASIGANTCFVKLNGNVEANVTTGTDTSGGGFTSLNQIGLGFWGGTSFIPGALNLYFDDFYLFDLTGGSDNAAFGSEHVHSVAPATLTLVSKPYYWADQAASSATFTGAASAVSAHAKSASSSATLSGSPSSVAKRVATSSDSATIGAATNSGSATPTGFTGFIDTRLSRPENIILSYGATLGRIISVSAADSFTGSSAPSEKDVGAKPVSALGGAMFVGSAYSAHNPSASASDSATFTGNLAISGHFVHAADSAKFTGSATTAPRSRASDSASFHSVATAGGSHANSASSSAAFTGLASASKPAVHVQAVHDSFVFLQTFASVHDTSVFVSAADSADFSDSPTAGGYFGHKQKIGDSAFFWMETATATLKQAIAKSSSDSARFSDSLSASFFRVRPVIASDSARFTDLASPSSLLVRPASASDGARFSDVAGFAANRALDVAASDSARFTDQAPASILYARPLSFSDSARFSDLAQSTAERSASASSSATLAGLASDSMSWPVAAVSSATLTGTAASNNFYAVAAVSSATFTGAASETVEHLTASDSASFTGLAAASVLLPSGLTIPGGDQSAGLRQILFAPLSQGFPLSYAESPEGILLMANGVDAPIAWDGFSANAWTAGVAAPGHVVWLDGSGSGTLLGRRWAYMRYVDSRGNYGNLSQISDPIDLGRDGFVSGVSYSDSGVVTVRAYGHGLSSGNTVAISDVLGLPTVNGSFGITVTDANHFALSGLVVTGGTYQSGGVWTKGVASIAYSGLELPTDPKIVRRQIIRNLAGDSSVFYVDIDTTDLTSTSLSSSQTDEQLATQCPVPVLWTNREGAADRFFQGDSPAAMRFGAPPSHKYALASYAGRIFAAADRVYSSGAIQVALGSPYALGIGTAFTGSFAGRLLYVAGCNQAPIAIASVMVAQQILVLESPYNGPSVTNGDYSIRPAPVERSLVYYSEPHSPEAWPAWNAFSVPETDDEITGLQVFRSFLFILKERNVFKFAYKNDPGRDGYVFPCVRRGSVNNRCAAYVDDSVFMLDEMGVHKFDGDRTEPISEAVGSIFTPDGTSAYNVDWTADRTLWHASLDQVRHTIRWHIDFVGIERLTLAVCYDYRGDQWCLEQYAEPVTSSALGVVGGYRRSLLGTTARRIFATGLGTLDGLSEDSTGTTRGTVCSGDSLTITDDTANFPANLAGVPVALVDGTGAGQTAIVSSNTSTTLSLVRPLDVTPDDTTTYQVGGVPWQWKSGWRRLSDDESENPRDMEFVFKPTLTPSTMDVQVFYDHDSVPADWAYDLSGDGISMRDDSPHTVFDLCSRRGYAVQRLSGHRDPYGYGHRYVAIQMSGAQGVDPTLVYQIILDGAE